MQTGKNKHNHVGMKFVVILIDCFGYNQIRIINRFDQY